MDRGRHSLVSFWSVQLVLGFSELPPSLAPSSFCSPRRLTRYLSCRGLLSLQSSPSPQFGPFQLVLQFQ
jgi:hypothetical protein